MTTYMVRVTDDLKYQVYLTTNGIDRRDVGPVHERPRAAYRYAGNLERGMPAVSPLRPAEAPSAPLPGASAGQRRR